MAQYAQNMPIMQPLRSKVGMEAWIILYNKNNDIDERWLWIGSGQKESVR
jgi:hypothetical protein